MRLVLAAVTAAMFATAATADAATADRDIKKMDEMLANARASDVFTNETVEEGVLVARHKPTGMICRLFMGLGEISYDPSSRSASCIMRRSTYIYALAVTPATANDTIEAVLAAAVAGDAKGRKVQDLPPSTIDTLVETDKLPKTVTKRFRIAKEYWRASAVRTGDWFVVMQTVSNQPGNPMLDVQQGLEWNESLQSISAVPASQAQ